MHCIALAVIGARRHERFDEVRSDKAVRACDAYSFLQGDFRCYE